MKSLYDIELNSANGEPGFLNQFKGKVTMFVNTTVGCGNANQMEVLQWLQEKYQDKGFQIVALPTNDYCGPGITKGRWSQGITCGLDSQNYGQEVYGVTFKFSEMVASNPNEQVSELPGKNGLGHEHKEPHEVYKTIAEQMRDVQETNRQLGIINREDFYSWWLNLGFDNGFTMGGNFEKYLVDKDGYAAKHFQCTVLNYDLERTLKTGEEFAEQRNAMRMGMGRSQKIFEEEYKVVCEEIEKLLAGERSVINPNYNKIKDLMAV